MLSVLTTSPFLALEPVKLAMSFDKSDALSSIQQSSLAAGGARRWGHGPKVTTRLATKCCWGPTLNFCMRSISSTSSSSDSESEELSLPLPLDEAVSWPVVELRVALSRFATLARRPGALGVGGFLGGISTSLGSAEPPQRSEETTQCYEYSRRQG